MERGKINISAPNLVAICIDQIEGGSIQGRMYHKYQKEPQMFGEVYKLLSLMEELFDRCGYPQSTTQNRYFKDRKQTKTKEALLMADDNQVLNSNGDLATFVVHVKYRQHSTWQGEVVWTEKGKKKSFRSALELLKLIDGALDSDTEIEEGGA